MDKHFWARIIFIVALVLLNLSCDQSTKSIARKEIELYQTIEVVGEYLILTKVENTGAFLSVGADLPAKVKYLLLTLLPALTLAFLLGYVLIHRELPLIKTLGFCFVIGGGIGNLYDRFLYGSVTDFLNLGIGDIRTGIFNMGDVSIIMGFLLLALNWFVQNFVSQPK